MLDTAAIEASGVGLRVDVGHPSRWLWVKDKAARATISEEGGCACSLLSDDADWDVIAMACLRCMWLCASPLSVSRNPRCTT